MKIYRYKFKYDNKNDEIWKNIGNEYNQSLNIYYYNKYHNISDIKVKDSWHICPYRNGKNVNKTAKWKLELKKVTWWERVKNQLELKISAMDTNLKEILLIHLLWHHKKQYTCFWFL